MVFYQYYCPTCAEEREERHGMSEQPEFFCSCGDKMRKKMTNGSFILRGQGWVSKGTGLEGPPKRGKEIGIAVDYDMKKAMQEAGEKV